jgi:hypothetical protein
MITKDSRYAKVGAYTVVDDRGREHRALRMRITPPTAAEFQHTITESDRLDLLAYQFYRKPDRFWRLCDANTAAMDPDELLQPGRRILVPPDQAG